MRPDGDGALSLDAEPLRKILNLEEARGFNDSAVIGGLDRFLRNWASQAVGVLPTPELLRQLRRLGLESGRYAGINPQERREWAGALREFLAGAEAAAKPPPHLGKVKEAAVPKKPRAARRPVPPPAASLDSPITALSGISTALAGKFGKLGVAVIRDLLYFFPHRHLDYSQLSKIADLAPGDEQTVIANVWEARVTGFGRRRGTEATVGDETGNIRVVWFNQPYLATKLATNTRIVISGRVSVFKGRFVFQSPEWEPLEGPDLVHTARMVPVYPLTQGLKPRQVRKLMKTVVDTWADALADYLPEVVRARRSLPTLAEAVRQAHFPDDTAAKDRARERLAFDELLLLQLGVMGKKRAFQAGPPARRLPISEGLHAGFLQRLPYSLTAAQSRVVGEILTDMDGERPMSRLLQGEVGSGKTVVATLALLAAAANGCQGAFMAPTEILAEQHFNTISTLLAPEGEDVGEGPVREFAGILPRSLTLALLKGDFTASQKKAVQQRLAAGEVDIIVGTHALIQQGVDFPSLGLTVVDEQHRFGVEQRSALRQKGSSPHMLVMTATPIPRTLALTLFGDLDISVLDELPPGRQAVQTKWLRPEQRNAAYKFISKQVGEGHQAFIICPLIEESEAVAAQAAVTEYEYLTSVVFPELKLGLLHGRLSTAEKDGVMEGFRAGRLHVLVATPVIEVGIDVPNATVMMVESADRFGLSQLHQFRGRVGRGVAKSYCMLLAENPSEVGQQRLDIIERVQDGFELAEEDLRLRGPGEFFGTRQSGLPDLKMALISDVALLEEARSEAGAIFAENPELAGDDYRALAVEVARVWITDTGEWS
ncbi:ATP-dependent DNA helicase RecG [Chloroflexota bacterium]